MSADDLIFRVQRIYEAIGAADGTDIGKFMPKVINGGRRVGLYQIGVADVVMQSLPTLHKH